MYEQCFEPGKFDELRNFVPELHEPIKTFAKLLCLRAEMLDGEKYRVNDSNVASGRSGIMLEQAMRAAKTIAAVQPQRMFDILNSADTAYHAGEMETADKSMSSNLGSGNYIGHLSLDAPTVRAITKLSEYIDLISRELPAGLAEQLEMASSDPKRRINQGGAEAVVAR